MNRQVRSWAYALPAIVSVTTLACVLVMFYLLFAPSEAVYKVKNPQSHYAYMKDGSIFVHREFCISDDKEMVTVNRDMVRADKEMTMRVTLATTSQIFKKGCQSLDRVLDIPNGTPPGRYSLEFVASWHVNRLRVDSTRLPVLTVDVPPKAK